MLRSLIRPATSGSSRDLPRGWLESVLSFFALPEPASPLAVPARFLIASVAALGLSTWIGGETPTFYAQLYPVIVIYAALTLPLNAALAVTVLSATGIRPFTVDIVDHIGDKPEFLMRPFALSLLCLLTFTIRSATYNALRSSASAYHQLAKNFPNGALFMFDLDLRFVLADGKGLAPAGLNPKELSGKTIWEALDADVAAEVEPVYRATLRGEEIEFEMPFAGAQYSVQTAPVRDADGMVIGGIVMTQDITDAHRARQADALLADIVESSDDAIFTKDTSGIVTSWNRGAEELYGYSAEEIIGESITTIVPVEGRDEAERFLTIIRSGQRLNHIETIRRRKDGELIHVSLSLSPMFADDGTVTGASGIARDITLRRQQQEAVEFLAYHDQLTRLPNRRLATDRLERAIAHSRRYGGGVGVMAIDLDGFKQINDTHGHQAGDAVLRTTAERLNSAIRDSDTAARMGGDEFLVILTGVNEGDASTTRDRISVTLADTVPYRGSSLRCPASVGLALLGKDGDDAEALLHAADRAMYREKAARRVLRR